MPSHKICSRTRVQSSRSVKMQGESQISRTILIVGIWARSLRKATKWKLGPGRVQRILILKLSIGEPMKGPCLGIVVSFQQCVRFAHVTVHLLAFGPNASLALQIVLAPFPSLLDAWSVKTIRFSSSSDDAGSYFFDFRAVRSQYFLWPLFGCREVEFLQGLAIDSTQDPLKSEDCRDAGPLYVSASFFLSMKWINRQYSIFPEICGRLV